MTPQYEIQCGILVKVTDGKKKRKRPSRNNRAKTMNDWNRMINK
jgi:hypothetical protein